MNLARRITLLLVLFAAVFALTGCGSPETIENESSRPWNTPRSWETGLPGFQQDRR